MNAGGGSTTAGMRCTRCGRLWVTMGLLSPEEACLICGGEVTEDDETYVRADAVRGAILAFNGLDFERMLDFMSEDVVWTPTSVLLGERARTFTGHDGLRVWVGELAGLYADVRFIEREFHLLPEDRVLVIGALTATSAATGAGLAEAVALILRVRDGRIARMDEYLDLGQARAEAGLAP